MLVGDGGEEGLEGRGLWAREEAVLEDALALVGPQAQQGQGLVGVVLGTGEGQALFVLGEIE